MLLCVWWERATTALPMLHRVNLISGDHCLRVRAAGKDFKLTLGAVLAAESRRAVALTSAGHVIALDALRASAPFRTSASVTSLRALCTAKANG